VAAAAERSGSDRLAEAVIAHELAHVARFDDLGLVLEQVASALFYFHPVLWWTARALGVERELAADRRVLSTRALSPRDYGHGLLQALGLDLTTTTVAAAAGSRRRLTMRIRHIADPRTAAHPKRAHSVLAAGLLLFLPALLLPPTATGQTAAASPAATLPPAMPVALPLVPLQSSGPGLDALLLALHPSSGPSLDDLMPGARVTSPFGMRRHPTSGESVHHGGIDLSTGAESPVYAPRGGIVERVAHDYGDQGRFGTVVVVDHGSGVKTFYAHLASSSVAAGQGVGDGDQIGVAGNTGVSSGPHLHFEIWKDGERVDPARIGEVVGGC
jgi:murein DD-endopeptidase MepM/ murein hydrolase activator NlpD